jgi:hypothetical protein
MRQLLSVLILASLYLTACAGVPTPDVEATETPGAAPAETLAPTPSQTPTQTQAQTETSTPPPATGTPTPPATGTPTSTPRPTSAPALGYDPSHPAVGFLLNQVRLVRHDPTRLVCVSRAGLNGLDEQGLEDGHVLGPYRGDFEWTDEEGTSSGNVLLKYENGSFVFIREEAWERFPGERPSLSFEEAMRMLESGQIVYLEGPARGVPECD